MTRLTPRLALLMTLPPALWAGNAVVGRLLVGHVPPLTLNFLRWALALGLLLPFGWRVLRAPGALLERAPQLLLLGTLGVGAYNALQYLALVSTTPINVTLIAASMPVWMLAIGALFYGVRPTRRQIIGAVLSLVGVSIVIARGEWATLLQVRFVPGDVYMIVAIVAWAFYSWLLARPSPTLANPSWDWVTFVLMQTLFGLLFSGSAALTEQALGAQAIQWTPGVVLALVYVAVGPSIVAFRCWGLGIERGGPALAAFFSNLTPLFAALMSALVFGEAPHLYHAAAFVLIVAGIVVSASTLPARPIPKEVLDAGKP